ncbi:uncharacterized protein EAE97_011866 [Botrytis byssoidea]|uniref:Uncharacterized protein n=1 Tax=Botrytis byssoidea TaxID=139641 RepID=A0A9P5HT21_9HELO|nr:uncharacterized protein EAE97_011866 [Botrytis byssoidea]KAF7918411.1 hypothetical protein EAE97_011866 [Botrytis byssoidea]
MKWYGCINWLESTRGENHGLFVNDSLPFFKPTANAYLSMSDNAALAVVAVAKCGGSSSGIKLRVGRIDATSASPAPCEHSLGRVHNPDGPNVFNSAFVTATNLDRVEPFDSTPGVWDPNNINEIYLTSTQPFKVCQRRQHFKKPEKKNTKCKSLSEKMIGVVSSKVTFSDTVQLMEWKAVDVMMDISLFGDVSISGLIRNLYTTTQPPKNISYSTTSSTGNSSTGTSSDLSGTGTSIFGSTIYWPLNSTIALGTTTLSFSNVPCPVNGNIFVLPAQSSFYSSSGSIIVKSATLTSVSGNEDMTAVLYVPTKQKGTISLKIVQQNVTLTSFSNARAYTLYSTGTKKVSSTGTVIIRVSQGGSSSRIVKSTTFGSKFASILRRWVGIMWLGNESPHFDVMRIIDSLSYRYTEMEMMNDST